MVRPPYSTLAFEPVPGVLIQTKVPVKFAAMTQVSKRPAAKQKDEEQKPEQEEEEAEEEAEEEKEEEEEEEQDCADQGEELEDKDDQAQGGAEEEEGEEEETHNDKEGEAITKEEASTKEQVSAEEQVSAKETKEKATAKSSSTIKRPASAIQRQGEEWEVQGLYKHQALQGKNMRDYIIAAGSIGKKHCVTISKKESKNYQALMRRLLSEAQTKVDDGVSLNLES